MGDEELAIRLVPGPALAIEKRAPLGCLSGSFELIARTGSPGPPVAGAGRVAALDHEVRDHAVELDARCSRPRFATGTRKLLTADDRRRRGKARCRRCRRGQVCKVMRMSGIGPSSFGGELGRAATSNGCATGRRYNSGAPAERRRFSPFGRSSRSRVLPGSVSSNDRNGMRCPILWATTQRNLSGASWVRRQVRGMDFRVRSGVRADVRGERDARRRNRLRRHRGDDLQTSAKSGSSQVPGAIGTVSWQHDECPCGHYGRASMSVEGDVMTKLQTSTRDVWSIHAS